MFASPLDSSNYLLVVAINIGTSDTGIAFSVKSEYERDPMKIRVHSWYDYSRFQHITTPTCAMFTKEKKFKAFGFEAESQYGETVEGGTCNDVYYFRHFIIDLFKNEVNGEFLLEDQTGKKMSSMDVLTVCIKYLRDRLTDYFKAKYNIYSAVIRWVLPVPVSSNNKGVKFMRLAAVKAGLPNEHVMIVKESEAAFLYCSLQNDEINKSSAGHPPWNERQFLLLNVNHFAVDITVHLVQPNSHNLELYKTTVENIGNTPLEQCLADIFCGDVMDSYIATYYSEYNEMKQGLGNILEGVMAPTVRCRIPPSLLSHFESKRDIKLADHITDCYGGIFKSGKLKLHTNIFKHKCRKIYEHIVCMIRRTFEINRTTDLSTIIIVGELSEYPMLHDVIREAFPGKQIIVSKNAKMDVLGGAVIYGHQLSTKKKLFSQH